VVLDEEHRDAGLLDAADQLGELADLGGVQAGGGLVQDEERRVEGQCPGHLQTPLWPVGKLARQDVREALQPHELEESQCSRAQALLLLQRPGRPEGGGPRCR